MDLKQKAREWAREVVDILPLRVGHQSANVPVVAKVLLAALREAWAEGAKDMQEEAAKLANTHAAGYSYSPTRYAVISVAEGILALPIEEASR